MIFSSIYFHFIVIFTNPSITNCERFLATIKNKIPVINDEFRHETEKQSSKAEMTDALKSIIKKKREITQK